MQQFQLDTNQYLYYKQEQNCFKYRHKYLVPDTEDEKSEDPNLWMGSEEKWSKWTDLDARQFAKENNVSILQTSKKPIKRRKK